MSCLSCRHLLALMGFLGIVNVYLCRINLSMAVVAMIGNNIGGSSSSANSTICPLLGSEEVGSEEDGDEGEFDWDSGLRGDLLGSYYYGYIWTQIPGGWLAQRYGFKRVWGITMLASGLLTLASPLAAEQGVAWLIGLRILIGLCHGVAFPSMQAAWSHWAPPLESTKMVSFHMTGASFGTVLIFPLSGLLAGYWNWRLIFYVTGALTVVWCCFWHFLVFDSPLTHPRISPEEKEHIITSMAEYKRSHVDRRKIKTPWKAIATSKPVWAVTGAHLASNWGNYQLNTMMPTYLSTVLRFDIKTNGFISALPYLVNSVDSLLGAFVTDYIRRNNLLRTITIRKIMTGLGLLVPAAAVVLAGHSGCNAAAAVAFLTISVGFNSFTVPGCKTSMLDFAPVFSGVIFGFSNTFANLTGFLAPQTTGHLLKMDNSLANWQIAFWISALIYIPGFLGFLFFGTDEVQEWAKEPEVDTPDEEIDSTNM